MFWQKLLGADSASASQVLSTIEINIGVGYFEPKLKDFSK